MKAVHVIISGRVQGVGFRYFTYRFARKLEIAGWVKNLPDGKTVELYAQGPLSDVDAVVSHVRQGPMFSKVRGVKVTVREPDHTILNFEIKY